MKTTSFCQLVLIGVLAYAAPHVTSAQQVHGDVGLGIRRHADHSKFDKLPFGKRDHSFSVSYEIHESVAYWQLGLSYTPDLTGDENGGDSAKHAWTPEINLLAKDRMYHAGLGIASTYTDADGGDWTSIYWQLLLGLRFELSQKLSLSGYGYYPFRRWGDISDFSARDLEYGLRFGYRF